MPQPHEQKHQQTAPPQFPEQYPSVGDQAAYERDLLEGFEQTFPDQLPALRAALARVVTHVRKGAGSSVLPIHVATEEAPVASQVVGELPNEAIALMGGIYALTEAAIVSDEQREEYNPHKERIIMRKGHYQGKPVFFKERWYTSAGLNTRNRPDQAGQQVLDWSVLHEAAADPQTYKARHNELYRIFGEHNLSPDEPMEDE